MPSQPIWRRRKNTRRVFIAIFLIWSLFDVMSVRWHLTHTTTQVMSDGLYGTDNNRETRGERIFIASTHWQNEEILRGHWNAAVLSLTQHLGADHVFVSVVESGSIDDSKGALRDLDHELDKVGVQRSIVLDYTTHEEEVLKPPEAQNWIMTPQGKMVPRRIPYLSRMRNLSLKPIEELAAKGVTFDKVLFLNDVVFDNDDFEALASTNGGHYAAACSLDFSKPPHFYDTFALRDAEGHDALMSSWPYFRARVSREAVKANRAVPVKSCWNGMVLMDAKPFYDKEHPLRFRGVSDTLAELHVEGSECCLVHVDNPLSRTRGVWVNPNVRVGYSGTAYEQVRPRAILGWMNPLRIFVQLWENRVRRWCTSTWLNDWRISDRIAAWSSDAPERKEPGVICLVDEMQVLDKYGWLHV